MRLAAILLLVALMSLPFGTLFLTALAECGQDTDWPERPCYDVGSPTNDELKQAWARYYEYKGEVWMEAKKKEMLQAIGNGTLQEWVLYQSERDNHANGNVYYYYYLNGQAPPLSDNSATRSAKVSTGWETDPAGWASIAAIGAGISAAAALIFWKSRVRS